MPARRLTRRSLLAAGAGALAGGLARPASVLAALAGPPQPVRSERWVGELTAGGQAIELARNADLVGVEWSGPAQSGGADASSSASVDMTAAGADGSRRPAAPLAITTVPIGRGRPPW